MILPIFNSPIAPIADKTSRVWQCLIRFTYMGKQVHNGIAPDFLSLGGLCANGTLYKV